MRFRPSVGVVEAAKFLGVCVRTLHTMTKAGKVPFLRIGRRILFDLETLDQWRKSQIQGAAVPIPVKEPDHGQRER